MVIFIIQQMLKEAEEAKMVKDRRSGKKDIGYLKTTQYAKKYCLSRTTVLKLCKLGQIKYFKTDSGHRRLRDLPPISKAENTKDA